MTSAHGLLGQFRRHPLCSLRSGVIRHLPIGFQPCPCSLRRFRSTEVSESHAGRVVVGKDTGRHEVWPSTGVRDEVRW